MIDDIFTEYLNQWVNDNSYSLCFTDPGGNRLTATFSDKYTCWVSGIDHTDDPLSIFLSQDQPEREKSGDDFTLTTLSKRLDKSLGWISSFQDGWYGLDNRSNSISGYLLGRSLRIKYIK